MDKINLTEYFLPYVLFFGRTAALFVITPGFGEHQIPARFRLMIAFALSFALGQVVTLPIATMGSPLTLLFHLVQEVLIGFMIGLVGRIIISILDMVGTIVSMQVGLGNAMMFNPSFGSQMPFVGSFLLLSATLLFFALDLHHITIHTLVKSYESFPIGTGLYGYHAASNTSEYLIKLMGRAIELGVQFSLPFLLLGTVFQFFLGLLNRLVPSLQVFFIMLPAQLMLGLILMMICFGFILSLAMGSFKDLLLSFPGLQ